MVRTHLWLVAALAACSHGPKTSTVSSDDAPLKFEDLAPAVATHFWQLAPDDGVSRGLHEFDGMLPDRSAQALANSIAQLQKDNQALTAVSGLTAQQALERDVLLQRVRANLFALVDRDVYHTNPMAYSDAINLDAYVIRDYAPAAQRAAAVIKLCKGLPAFLAQARTNIKLPIPRTWIDTALLQTKGYIEFADHDVRQVFTKIDVPLANQAEIEPALEVCKSALAEHAAWLEKQQPSGTTDFALGAAKFLAMLKETEGIEIEIPKLQAIADEDLRRNTAAIEEAAHAIDPKRPVAAVVAEQATKQPAAADLLTVATKQAEEIRAFIVAHDVVTIPSDDVVSVRESPPFQRWNAAFLDRPGVFETKPLPSYYYISPPDPKWPPAEQAAYIPPTADLEFVTVHEVWPGHFLHGLHIRKNPSRVLQAFCTYAMSEGWAHYTEEMMYDAGLAKTPQARIGMLKEALLRDVRFQSAIGLHTRGMTVDESQKLFAQKAFVDAGNARQQAVRGTFDPMYLAYTVGKLVIRKLHTDWLAANPGKSLREFHDTLLSYGCAPLPVIRRAMLGEHAGPPL